MTTISKSRTSSSWPAMQDRQAQSTTDYQIKMRANKTSGGALEPKRLPYRCTAFPVVPYLELGVSMGLHVSGRRRRAEALRRVSHVRWIRGWGWYDQSNETHVLHECFQVFGVVACVECWLISFTVNLGKAREGSQEYVELYRPQQLDHQVNIQGDNFKDKKDTSIKP